MTCSLSSRPTPGARIHHTSLAEIIRRALHQYAELIRQEEGQEPREETAIVSRNGEIWIPKKLRQELGVNPGNEFHVIQEPDGFKLRPVPPREGATRP
jgi:AbrB family looped-hinge helix DNA binding protein